ncbi:MAG: HNH endonuclease [Planctomycetota bacterium]
MPRAIRNLPRRRARRDERPAARGRGYDGAWKRVRDHVMNHVGRLCQDCLAGGRIRPADLVHHEATVRDSPERRLDGTNLVALCRSCHGRRHSTE